MIHDSFLRLHYIRAVIAEVQRFSDITPTGIGHKTVCDVSFQGFHLPAVRMRRLANLL